MGLDSFFSREWLLPTIIGLVGLVASVAAFQTLTNIQRTQAEQVALSEGRSHLTAIQEAMDVKLETLHAMTAFFNAAGVVDRQDFEAYASSFLERNPSIRGLEWIPKVMSADRAAFEGSARRDGLEDFVITERAQDGSVVVAGERETYFPVHFVVPFQGNEAAIGFDLFSNPQRRAALQRARDTGRQSATGPIILVQDTQKQPALLVFQPVYTGRLVPDTLDGRRDRILGFTLIVLSLGEVIRQAVDSQPHAADITVYDVTNPHAVEPILAGEISSEDARSVTASTTLEFAGRIWRLTASPVSKSSASTTGYLPWAALLLGLILTSFILYTLVQMVRRRRSAEAVVRHRTHQLRELNEAMEKAIEGVSILNPDGEYTYVNEAYATAHGYEPEELLGLHWSKTVLPQDLERMQAEYQAMRESGLSTTDAKGLRKDGSQFHKYVTMISRHDDKGSFLGHHCFITDGSEAADLRESLRKQQAELEFIFNTVPVRIWYKDAMNRILRLNVQAAESMGISVEEAEGADTYDLFPEMAKKYHDDDLEVIRSGKPKLGIVEEYTPVYGERGWVRTDKVPYTNEETGEKSLLVVASDVTREQEIEAALRESEKRFALAASGASVGIWDWLDVKSNAEWWSPIFYELLGYEEGEISPSLDKFTELLHPDDRERTFALVDSHLENRSQFRLEYRLKHKTDGYRWFLGSGQAIWNEQGEPTRMIGSIMDIHSLKQTQETLEERTAWLEKANADLDHFAYIASHDLRAPLRGVENLAEWIADDFGEDAPADVHKKLALLRGRVARMDQLLQDILAYSRAGKREAEPALVDCQAILRDVSDWIEDKDGFEIRAEPPLPEIYISPTLIEQVLLNLISNAIKHHDKPKGLVTVEYNDRPSTHQFVVRDDGPGIPAEFRERVFKMFQTLRPRDDLEGSGIGLAIVKKIVESAGGIVRLEANENQRGAAFFVTIPKHIDASMDAH